MIVDCRVTVCIVGAVDGIMSAAGGIMSANGVGVVEGAESSGLVMRQDDGVLLAILVVRLGLKDGVCVGNRWTGRGVAVMV
jgi:hypothetical protein